MKSYSQSAYESAAMDGATQGDLLIAVYSKLAKDFLLAAEAVRQNGIETRCNACKHALLLLGHLEGWLAEADDPKLAASLDAFYQMLRSRTMQNLANPDAASFDELGGFVLDAGAAWKDVQRRAHATATFQCLSDAEASNFSYHA